MSAALAIVLGLLAHMVGDYVLQSDWMASKKTSSWRAACAHALAYTLPFAIITQAPAALVVIFASHAVIDRFRLARFVVFAKNFLAPRPEWPTWSECSATGYHESRPAWLAVWLLIIADNTIHIAINSAALVWLS